MKQNPRRTKIIATLGPQTDNEDILRQVLQHGANLVRLNLSHGSIEDQINRLLQVKRIAKDIGKIIGILVDLQGPKIRIRHFEHDQITLKEESVFILDAGFDGAGDDTKVGLDYAQLPQDVRPGDTLLLDDGLITLTVQKVENQQIFTQVIAGGVLKSKKGVNRLGGGLSAQALTEKDKQAIEALSGFDIDYVALSFVKSAEDVMQAKQWMMQYGVEANVCAKIERLEAIQNIDEILQASDAIMVARGDLGVELGYAELPGMQKDIIARAQAFDKVVITATQMMESMIQSPIPTRAEASDVANAILDGTDAVMLSAETATGRHPEKVIKALDDICYAAEKHKVAKVSNHRVHSEFARHDEAIAMASMYVANHLPVKAIVALTESGSTPLWMSRIRSSIPIYALSRHAKSCGRMTLYRGVYPVEFDVTQYESWEVTRFALSTLVQRGLLSSGDKVIVTKGNIIGVGGKANSLKIITA